MKRMSVAWAAVVLALGGLVVGTTPGTAVAKGSQTAIGGARAPEPSGVSQKSLTSGKRVVCVNVLVDSTGWQGWRCGEKGKKITGGAAGTTKKAKAVSIAANGVGELCAKITIQSSPAQVCVSDGTVLTLGGSGGPLRLDTLQVKTKTGVCGTTRATTAAWPSYTCAKAGKWLKVGRPWANALGLSV